jgi:hypothetical protein
MRRPDIVVPAALSVALLCLAGAGCREKGRPDPNVRMAISHDRESEAEPGRASTDGAAEGAAPETQAAGGTGTQAQRIPNRLEVPPAVVKAWSGIRLHWKDSQSGKEGSLDVPLGGAAILPDSDLQVRADVFLPAFTMTADAITSSSIEPENPAARIDVLEKGNPIFGGWVFTRFPDVHPFQHPRFSLRLEGGVRRSS